MYQLFITIVFIFSNLGFASDDCRLERPLSLGIQSLLEQSITLLNATFDSTPKFTQPESYNPKLNTLELHLFNVEYNRIKTGYLGAAVSISGLLESVGFSFGYFGNFNIKGSKTRGSVTTTNEKTTYQTNEIYRHSEPQHAKNDAITESTVVVENGYLTSVILTIPVYRVWKTDGYSKYIAFTGEHQTLCLKSAR